MSESVSIVLLFGASAGRFLGDKMPVDNAPADYKDQ